MKIYPSDHEFKLLDRIGQGDIPLAFLNARAKKRVYHHKKEVNDRRSVELSEVSPYDMFSTSGPYLYDKNLNRVEVSTHMMRQGDEYAYFPSGSSEFYPETFEFSALFKKGILYKGNESYNINVGVIDKDGAVAKELIKIFGNAYKKGEVPPNVTVNHGETKWQELSNVSYEETDLLIIESLDGIHYWDSEDEIDFKGYLEQNLSVWVVQDSRTLYREVSTESDEDDLYFVDEQDNEELQDPLREDIQVNTMYQDVIYSVSNRPFDYPRDDYINNEKLYYDIGEGEQRRFFQKTLSPVGALYAENKGWIFRTSDYLVNNALTFKRVIFNILGTASFQGYVRTDKISSWIADEPVDYIFNAKRKFGKSHLLFDLDSLTKDYRVSSQDSFSLVSVDTSKEEVVFYGLDTKDNLVFKKISEREDPKKPSGHKSIYTGRDSVIYYKKDGVNKVESPLDIYFNVTPAGDYVVVERYISTHLTIDTKERQSLKIPSQLDRFRITYLDGIVFIHNNLTELKEGEVLLATVELREEYQNKNYDIRTSGGGLPESEESDYNLLDIGNPRGRPYRKGGAMVIRLSPTLQEYESLIQDEVQKHISVGDVPILIFE